MSNKTFKVKISIGNAELPTESKNRLKHSGTPEFATVWEEYLVSDVLTEEEAITKAREQAYNKYSYHVTRGLDTSLPILEIEEV